MLLLLLYVAVTILGLFPFHGIPILNIALGFPIGAAIAHRGLGDEGGGGHKDAGADRGRAVMRRVFYGSLATAGVTLLICWIQLVVSILVLRVLGLGSPLASLLPLLPSPIHPNLFRAQLFAVILAPALLVLTTVFGGVLTLIVHGPRDDGDGDGES